MKKIILAAVMLVFGCTKKQQTQYVPVVNIRWFNCDDKDVICDTCNYTEAFQRAINAVNKMGGGVVYFPQGVYKLK